MTDRLARTSTGAEKRCRFCRGPVPNDQRKPGAKKSFEKVFCSKTCRGNWNTHKYLDKKIKSYGGLD